MTSLTPTQLAVLRLFAEHGPMKTTVFMEAIVDLEDFDFIRWVHRTEKNEYALAVTDSGRALLTEIDEKEKK